MSQPTKAARAAAALALVACGCLPVPPRKAPPPEGTEVSFAIEYTFAMKGNTSFVRVIALVPKTLPRRQIVRGVAFSPEPVRTYEAADRRYAEFFFSGRVRTFQVRIAGRARLLRNDLLTARASGGPSPAEGLAPGLMAEPSLEKDDPEIAKAAAAIEGEDELDTVRRIYDFVMDRIEYHGPNLSVDGGGAAKAVRSGKGDCTEYADLMVALCRAKGNPARTIIGLFKPPGATDIPQHSWVEVHTTQHGWVPFDPSVDDNSENASFERLKPLYLWLSPVRNDALLENRHAYAVFRWWGDRVTQRERYELRALSASERR